MTNKLERARREQAVIDAGRTTLEILEAHEEPTVFLMFLREPLRYALEQLDALELGPTDKTKSRGVECTSEMAAAFMNGRKARELSGRVLRALLGPLNFVGATVDELVQFLGRPHQSVSARVNELVDNGWLLDSRNTRPTRSGLDAIVWKLTPSAIIYLSKVQDVDSI